MIVQKISYFFISLLLVAFLTACNNHNANKFVFMEADVTGINFQNEINETPANNIMTYQYMYNGAGVATGDINQDGLPDIYLSGNSVANKLFLNKGKWKFEDITAAAKISDRPGDWKTGVTMADVNGDGLLDIYICYSGNTEGEGLKKPVLIDNPHRTNQLFINNGCKPGEIPTFTESAKEFGLDAAGTFSTQSYFLDYDLDGDLDMFLLNHANTFYSSLFNTTKLRQLRHPFFGNKLYRNDIINDSGETKNIFVEVSEQSGIHGSGLNYGLSAAISDINNDRYPDIYVTNDYDEQDFFYLNNGDGSFKEISKQSFGHLSKYSMGTDVADINNDGRPDLYVVDMLPEDNRRQKLLKGADQYDKYTLAVDSGYHHQNMRNTLQINCGIDGSGEPAFVDLGQMAGVSNTDWSWGPLIADFDNDGLKDIVVTNGYLHDYTNMDFLKYMQTEMGPLNNPAVGNQDMLPLIQKMPSTKISSYAFQNKGDLHFENKTKDWGLDQPSISNGIAYADLDNDGDLDLVINRLDDQVAVYQNNTVSKTSKFIKIKLAGSGSNTYGVGAKISIAAGDKKIFHEAFFSRGYESSVEPVFTIGVGAVDTIKEIKVTWTNGKQSLLNNVKVNQTIIVSQKDAVPGKEAPVNQEGSLFVDAFATSGINFRHEENQFVDFKVQRLIPYQASRLGSRQAVGDVNDDGNDDIYFGGSIGKGGELYLGKDDGTYVAAASQPWQSDKMSEDVGLLFLDVDKDKDLDLYIVSGGNEYGSRDPLYHDRLYINEGNGVFVKALNALPETETTSGSCVVTSDFDKDGDLDLFVGGRIAAQMYPLVPKSYILRNDSKGSIVKFTDVTEMMNKELQLAGMVSDAVWNDVDKDGWSDLIVIGEWMPVRIFKNEKGKSFTEISDKSGVTNSEGWWSTIYAADVDDDGDTDFLLGNAGTNLQYHASAEEPLEFFVQDINNDGGPDPIMCYYIQGKSYPAATLDELTEQLPGIRKKFFKYADYANATINDVMDEKLLDQALHLKITTLQSSWMENLGNGNFDIKPLPEFVQTSMINGFVQDDFDGDQQKEILCAGNFYPYKVEWGRSDAFMGAMLKFKNGKVSVYRPGRPLWMKGDIRSVGMVQSKNGGKAILLSRNDDQPGLFRYGKFSGTNIALK